MEIKELAEIVVDRLNRLDEKMDDTREALSRQVSDLAHFNLRVTRVEDEIEPLKQQSARWKGAAWLTGIVVAALEAWHQLTR